MGPRSPAPFPFPDRLHPKPAFWSELWSHTSRGVPTMWGAISGWQAMFPCSFPTPRDYSRVGVGRLAACVAPPPPTLSETHRPLPPPSESSIPLSLPLPSPFSPPPLPSPPSPNLSLAGRWRCQPGSCVSIGWPPPVPVCGMVCARVCGRGGDISAETSRAEGAGGRARGASERALRLPAALATRSGGRGSRDWPRLSLGRSRSCPGSLWERSRCPRAATRPARPEPGSAAAAARQAEVLPVQPRGRGGWGSPAGAPWPERVPLARRQRQRGPAR